MNSREHVAIVDGRLDRLSVARRLVTSLALAPRAVELAIYQPGKGNPPVRPALPFRFGLEAWNQNDETNGLSPSRILRGRATVLNESNPLLPMPSTAFAFTLALPPEQAEEIYYRDPVSNAQQAAADAPPVWLAVGPINSPHAAVRAEVERIYTLPGTVIPSGQGNATFTCRVMGHRLSRRNDRYAEPGSGVWTLLRLVEPGDGWCALNLSEGFGEFFSAGRDAATTLCGQHLARAIA